MNDTGSAWVTCPIWETPCEKIKPVTPEKSAWEVNSPRAGGKYIFTHTAYGGITTLDELSKVKLSRWIYEQNQLGKTPEIDANTLKEVSNWPMPSVLDRMDYCLQFLESKTEALGATVDMASCSDEIQAATLLKNADEIDYLIEEFRDEGWIKPSAESDSSFVVIRRKGYQRLEELRKANVASE